MKSLIGAAFTASVLLLGFAWPAASQGNRMVVALRGEVRVEPSEGSLLATPARLEVKGVTVAEGLLLLATASEVNIAFSPNSLPEGHRVDCLCEQATLAEALDQLLSGTEFGYLELGDQIVVARRAQPQTLESLRRPPATLASTRPRGPANLGQPAALAEAVTLGPNSILRQQVVTGTVTGRVVDRRSQVPLATTQVYIPGLQLGTLTGPNGSFLLLSVPAGEHELRAERIGYGVVAQQIQVTANQTTRVNLQLAEEALALEEIVVTGTAGEARVREIGFSLSSISGRDLELAPVRHLQDAIGARATGVTVLANSGQPGAGGAIRLRGNNSVSQGNNPLIYVDGVRIYSELSRAGGSSRQRVLPLNDISPEDIERIEIVKGAAATTLYGTEASGGVIQVFTKRGSAGEAIWTAEVTQGFNQLTQFGDPTDPTGMFMKVCRGPDLVDSWGRPFEDATCPESGSWLRNGPVRRYSLSVRGGAAALTYFLSGSFNEEHGAIDPNWSKDGGFRANFSFRPLETLDIMVNSSYRKRTILWVPDGNFMDGFTLNVTRGPSNNFKQAGACSTPDMTCLVNAEVFERESLHRSDHYINGITVRWEPNERIANRFTVGYDFSRLENDTHVPFGFRRIPEGSISLNEQRHTLVSLDYVGTYRSEIMGLSSHFSWGGQLFESRDRYISISGVEFAGPGEPTVTSGARSSVGSDSRLRVINAGFFLQEMIGWRDRLFLTAGLRVDGNSAFGETFGLQPYPKVSASYVLSDYERWPGWWDGMKLRAAVGESGKAPGAFDAVRTWEPIAADDGQPGFTPGRIGNLDLGPERTREYEVGFDASLLNGRLGAELTYYYQRTMDALVPVLYSPTLGFAARQLENVGTLENKGVEFAVEGALVHLDNLEWTGRVIFSTNRSEALDLSGEDIPVGVRNRIREGYPVPAYFGRRIVNPNEIADPIVEQDVFNGQTYPTRTIGFGSSLNLGRSFIFDILFEHQGGHYQANWPGYQNALRGVWWPCYETQAKLREAAAGNPAALNDVTALERGRCAIDRTRMNADYWIEAADFIKLRSVSVHYQLPERWVPGGRSARVSLSGRNLFKWTGYTGMDPEVADQSDSLFGRRDYYNLPPLRSLLASVRVTF